MAEFLIRAKGHWMDGINTGTLNIHDLEMYNRRSQLGDIVVIRPDDWVWGSEEKLPNFIVVKVPGLSVETVKQYEWPLITLTPDITQQDGFRSVITKKRRYFIKQTYIETLVTQNKSVITINATLFNSNLLEK